MVNQSQPYVFHQSHGESVQIIMWIWGIRASMNGNQERKKICEQNFRKCLNLGEVEEGQERQRDVRDLEQRKSSVKADQAVNYTGKQEPALLWYAVGP